jgi:hypothetical protein
MCVQETTRPCQKRRLKLQATDDADRVYLCVVCVCARVRPAFRRMMSWTKVALAAAAALAAVEHASAFAPIGAPGTGAATRCTHAATPAMLSAALLSAIQAHGCFLC